MNRGIDVYIQDGRKVVKGLGYYEGTEIKDLKELIKNTVKKYGDSVGFKFKDKEGRINCKTYIEFDRDIDALGTALISMGLKNKHIAIISENRYEWAVCYFSIINGVGVVVPMDKNLPKNEIENLIERGKVDTIFYSKSFHSTMKEIAEINQRVEYFICMDDLDNDSENTLDKNLNNGIDSKFVSLCALIDKGRELIKTGDRTYIDEVIDRNKLSVLLFTSGTTNISKGVMLSHANIASNVTGVTTVIYAGPGDVHLSILPLHHTYENTVGMAVMINYLEKSNICDTTSEKFSLNNAVITFNC